MRGVSGVARCRTRGELPLMCVKRAVHVWYALPGWPADNAFELDEPAAALVQEFHVRLQFRWSKFLHPPVSEQAGRRAGMKTDALDFDDHVGSALRGLPDRRGRQSRQQGLKTRV